jgi:hypothetical protein
LRGLLAIAAPALLLATGVDWIAALGGSLERDPAGHIRTVNLRATWVTDGDLIELARLPKLETLDLSQTRITDQGLAYLKMARGLLDVNLAYAEKIGDPAHAVIREWKHLRRLSLRGTVIADETAASAASLPELEMLDIGDSIVGDVGLEALALAPKLKELSMGNIRISDYGYQSLREFTNLRHLDLSGGRHRGFTTMKEEAVEAVASLSQLRVLRLGHIKFPAKSMAVLSRLPSVERLGLEFCPEVGDDALPHIAGWKSLRWVDLHGTKVTPDGVAELRKQRPDCTILY